MFLSYAVISLLLVGMVSAPPAAACVLNHQGIIRLPTLSTQPPLFFADSLQGIYAYKFVGIIPGVSFELSAVAGSSCPNSSLCNPDFNLIFQKQGSGPFADQVGPTHNGAGTVSGNVPLTAQWALIWMRHGPDVPNNDGNLLFAVFNYGEVC